MTRQTILTTMFNGDVDAFNSYMRELGKRGGQVTKLSPRQQEKVRQDNRPATHIARDYGVSPHTIYRIKNVKA